jgi:cytochrome c oxidase subunit 2
MRHYVIVALLVVGVAVLSWVGLNAVGLMPEEASAQAASIDQLFNLELIFISFLFALIVVPMAYSLVVFRRRNGETGDGEHIEGNTRLEIGWTIVPLFIVIGFAWIGAWSLGETRREDPNAMVIQVTGFQWGWQFEYPEYGGFSSDTLYLPKGRQVVLKMESRDVVHSFWVPEFRVKQDLVPGRVTEYRITPIEDGAFKVRCAELCGTRHAYMEAPVNVVDQAEFESWARARQAEAEAAIASGIPDARRGQKLYSQFCQACHTINGNAGTGPTWLGVYDHEVELADGTTVTADEAYLYESIAEPGAKTVKGFPAGAMPKFGLTDLQIKDLIEYIKTLK